MTNIAILEERGRLKKLLFQNEFIIYKKEYDIRLVASLCLFVSGHFYTGVKFKYFIIRIDWSIPSLEGSILEMQHLNELTDTVTAQSRTAYSDLQRVSIFQHMHVINNTLHLCFTVICLENERKIAKKTWLGVL